MPNYSSSQRRHRRVPGEGPRRCARVRDRSLRVTVTFAYHGRRRRAPRRREIDGPMAWRCDRTRMSATTSSPTTHCHLLRRARLTVATERPSRCARRLKSRPVCSRPRQCTVPVMIRPHPRSAGTRRRRRWRLTASRRRRSSSPLSSSETQAAMPDRGRHRHSASPLRRASASRRRRRRRRIAPPPTTTRRRCDPERLRVTHVGPPSESAGRRRGRDRDERGARTLPRPLPRPARRPTRRRPTRGCGRRAGCSFSDADARKACLVEVGCVGRSKHHARRRFRSPRRTRPPSRTAQARRCSPPELLERHALRRAGGRHGGSGDRGCVRGTPTTLIGVRRTAGRRGGIARRPLRTPAASRAGSRRVVCSQRRWYPATLRRSATVLTSANVMHYRRRGLVELESS
mmetsp:Transcript_17582/g.61828  ORF Transcript_17582/g.61828 Transcript_17582/m.61828 type:complete len:402 (-) Transcript_17582:673-1878(-)